MKREVSPLTALDKGRPPRQYGRRHGVAKGSLAKDKRLALCICHNRKCSFDRFQDMRLNCIALISVAATLALGATIPKIKSDLQAVVTALNYMNRDLDSFVSPDALHGAVRLPLPRISVCRTDSGAQLIAQDAGGVVNWLQTSTRDVNVSSSTGI